MKRLLLCVAGLLAFQLWAGTRTVAHSLRAGEVALFAVPDGCSFASASASSAAGASVAVTVGEPTTMNSVTLVSVTVAADATVTVVFADGAPSFTGRPAKVLRERIRAQVVNPAVSSFVLAVIVALTNRFGSVSVDTHGQCDVWSARDL